ncbi:MAG: hypothetical protein R2792_10245 [Saprospiraceae bacterium]
MIDIKDGVISVLNPERLQNMPN